MPVMRSFVKFTIFVYMLLAVDGQKLNCLTEYKAICPLKDDLNGRQFDVVVEDILPRYVGDDDQYLKIKFLQSPYLCLGGNKDKCEIPASKCDLHREFVFNIYGDFRKIPCISPPPVVKETPPSTLYTPEELPQILTALERIDDYEYNAGDGGTIAMIVGLCVAGMVFLLVLWYVFFSSSNNATRFKNRFVPGRVEWYRNAKWADTATGRSLAKLYQQALRRGKPVEAWSDTLSTVTHTTKSDAIAPTMTSDSNTSRFQITGGKNAQHLLPVDKNIQRMAEQHAAELFVSREMEQRQMAFNDQDVHQMLADKMMLMNQMNPPDLKGDKVINMTSLDGKVSPALVRTSPKGTPRHSATLRQTPVGTPRNENKFRSKTGYMGGKSPNTTPRQKDMYHFANGSKTVAGSLLNHYPPGERPPLDKRSRSATPARAEFAPQEPVEPKRYSSSRSGSVLFNSPEKSRSVTPPRKQSFPTKKKVPKFETPTRGTPPNEMMHIPTKYKEPKIGDLVHIPEYRDQYGTPIGYREKSRQAWYQTRPKW